jgi:hypothetical protein
MVTHDLIVPPAKAEIEFQGMESLIQRKRNVI